MAYQPLRRLLGRSMAQGGVLLFRAKQDSGVACEGAITKKKRVVLVRKPLKIILMLLLGVSLGLAACTSEPSLIRAAKEGDTETVKTLLAAGADVNAQNWVGQTALMQAAWHGHTAIVLALVAAGADVHPQNEFGQTALMQAAWHGHTAIVQILKEAGARE